MQANLGHVDAWPSEILRNMFYERPPPPLPCDAETYLESERKLKTVAFFFGNGVPCDLGCQFYQACNRRRSAYVEIESHEWYHVWMKSSSSYKPHM